MLAQAAEVVAGAGEDVLGYVVFPRGALDRIYSTTPMEGLNEEVKHPTNVVGVFPNEASVLRLVGIALPKIWDEWQIGRRYFGQEWWSNPSR